MPKLNFSRIVPFSPAQMLELVSDLEAYPDFVPNCSAMEIRNKTGSIVTSCDATMHVNFGPISQAYTSRVSIDSKTMTISAHALDGPFSLLDSQWNFASEGDGSRVNFQIDFGFSNPIIAAVAEPAFSGIQGEILDAFIAEAKRRYA